MSRTAGEPLPEADDAAALQDVWSLVVDRWAATTRRALALPEPDLHRQVEGEWSFVETLRHLVFVTDAWVGRALHGVVAPYHPWGLPPTGARALPVPSADVRASVAEVLEVREARQRSVTDVLGGLTDEGLVGSVVVRGPGYPRAGRVGVARCVRTVLQEEWRHRQYAERDLACLAD